mmetsp:Transcript_11417/g.18580  ORF Transcript_11417/g.18580 Transcript_11417/m.18580 type:complete len:107 (-) Transcript_11417:99-419(-)
MCFFKALSNNHDDILDLSNPLILPVDPPHLVEYHQRVWVVPPSTAKFGHYHGWQVSSWWCESGLASMYGESGEKKESGSNADCFSLEPQPTFFVGAAFDAISYLSD